MSPVPAAFVGGNERSGAVGTGSLLKEVRMDLYLEFRKMVRPLVIEDINGETVETEDYSSISIPNEREEVEEDQSSMVFAG